MASRVISEKKSKSAVEGDILLSLANKFSDLIAVPATRIFNYALGLQQWPPTPWLVETQSAIPKTDNPSDFNQLRNLSCTNSLLKILESFVLEKLQGEVVIGQN